MFAIDQPPNKSPEPTVVGVCGLSEKVQVFHRFSSTVAQLFSLGGLAAFIDL